MTSKITLQLNESNHLKFKINVQGTTTEPQATKPSVRLVISEKDNHAAMGFYFPVMMSENDLVTFLIPKLEHIIDPKKDYMGKIEVILGTRIFVPMTLDVNFENPIKIEAAQVVEAEVVREASDMDVLEILSEVETTIPAGVVKTDKKKQITLTKTQLEELINKRRKGVVNPKVPSVLKEMKVQTSTEDQKVKDAMKSLMKSALEED